MEDLQPRIVLEHRGRGTYKVKLKTNRYWKYIAGDGFSADAINKAYNLKVKIAFWDLAEITRRYAKDQLFASCGNDLTCNKENALNFKEELEALILLKKMAK